MSVIKESFFKANFKTIEEFDSAEIAAGATVSNNAELKIMDIKLGKSIIKTNKKESNDGKEQQSVEKI